LLLCLGFPNVRYLMKPSKIDIRLLDKTPRSRLGTERRIRPHTVHPQSRCER